MYLLAAATLDFVTMMDFEAFLTLPRLEYVLCSLSAASAVFTDRVVFLMLTHFAFPLI
jgi:hypothetical protein